MEPNEITIYLEERVCQRLGIKYNFSGQESTHVKEDIIQAIRDCSRFDFQYEKKAEVIWELSGEKVILINQSSGHFKVKIA